MGNDDGGHPFFNQVFDNVEYLADHLRVECGGRLVKEHNIRFHCQCAHDGKTLFLTAGQSLRILVIFFQQTNTIEQFFCHLGGFCLLFLVKQHRSHGDIFADGHVRKDVEVLEHHAHLLTVQVDVDTLCGDVFSFKEDVSAVGYFQQVQAAQEGALAAAGRTDDGNDLSFGDVFADALEDLKLPKAFMKIGNVDQIIGISHLFLISFPVQRFL